VRGRATFTTVPSRNVIAEPSIRGDEGPTTLSAGVHSIFGISEVCSRRCRARNRVACNRLDVVAQKCRPCQRLMRQENAGPAVREFPLRSHRSEAPRRFVGLNHSATTESPRISAPAPSRESLSETLSGLRVSRGDYRVLHAVGGRAWRRKAGAFGALAEPAACRVLRERRVHDCDGRARRESQIGLEAQSRARRIRSATNILGCHPVRKHLLCQPQARQRIRR